MARKQDVYLIDDLERHASVVLPKMVRDYFNGGALDGCSLRANRTAYQRYHIRPRALRNVKDLQTQIKVFPDGNSIPFPCAVAPAAMQKMAHPDGEEATARACGGYGTVMGLSTYSTTSLDEVKKAADAARHTTGLKGPSELVLQVYVFEDRSVTEQLIHRAEACGYKAIVLTVDTPQFGRRLTEIRNGFKLPPHLKMANFPDELGVKTGSELRTGDLEAGKRRTLSASGSTANKLDPSLTWDILPWLKSLTRLPIWLKGIMGAEDAILSVQHGADAIFVSNHGGRQLDQAPPTLDVLPGIVKAVGGKVPIHFDGGVRRGSDIFKALCLGADMVWIGRPVLWGLAYDGEYGVINALRILEDEFKECMMLSGCSQLDELGPHLLVEANHKFSKI
ncbi:FMN-dependent dehydrogenase [Hypoxylon trugodes]|uniref:FMN-dependent dehydrogenase n=1 Tax=Hypoxylon trugodes TaxID=326681 RepID=UPI002197D687|nr:FMN-dependent dehydrogenase [Hypoxylon trugodes]KAI1391734.1 FMN-dependent dehydrogenase [Hypoxylon trugodes]